jgi:hypothetical protein
VPSEIGNGEDLSALPVPTHTEVIQHSGPAAGLLIPLNRQAGPRPRHLEATLSGVNFSAGSAKRVCSPARTVTRSRAVIF